MRYKGRFSSRFGSVSGSFQARHKKWMGTLLIMLALTLLMPINLSVGVRPAHAANNWIVTSVLDTVGTCPDAANCTLRQAITNANGDSGDTITFGVSGTIILGSILPPITATMTIDGTGQTPKIDGTNKYAVFNVSGGGNLTLNTLIILNGKDISGNGGGGLFNNGGTVTILNSTFANNTAPNSSGPGQGGGLSNNLGTVIIQNSTFDGNSATGSSGFGSRGGGLFNNAGTVTIQNSTFANNTAPNSSGSGQGGGLFNNGGTVTIQNSTFANNSAAGFGGGVYTIGMLTVQNSTFNGNSAIGGSGQGGGIANASGTLNLGSTIVAGNTDNVGVPDIVNGATFTSLGYSLIGNANGATGYLSSDQLNVNPLLNTLGNYGGPTQTMSFSPGSKAITSGNCALPSPAVQVTSDQRGAPRRSPLTKCDVGAFESPSITLSPGTLPNDTSGSNYNQTLVATSTDPFSGTFTFAATAGTLPNGLVLNNSGALSGKLTLSGPFSFTVTATDSHGFIGSQAYTVTIVPPRIDSIGVFRSGTFLLRLHNSTGFADITVSFNPGTKPYPVIGDWTGAGFDTVGAVDQSNGLFSLCNANVTATCANSANATQLVLGNPNDQPLSGKWANGFTHFGVGVFRPSNGLIYLKNNLATGFADYTMVLGIPGDVGLAGDWNGDGLDSPGVYRTSNQHFYLADQVCNCSPTANYSLQYGVAGDYPVNGDWVGQGHDGVGLFRQSNGFTYLRNTLTTGFADISFTYGIAGDIPVAGHWQLTYPPAPNPANVFVSPTSAPQAGTGSTGLGD